jgi:peptidyl-prolyl cis-trans isomerase-like 3
VRHHCSSQTTNTTDRHPRPCPSRCVPTLCHLGRAANCTQLHTTKGDIKLEVFCEAVPKTAENFLALCASAFYNSSPFHRLIPSFMVQTGALASDPKSKTSTSIYDTPNQLFEDEIRPALRHNARGIVSMANKGANSNGSQFFITFAPAPHLDGKNTVFGKVLEGWEVLDDMESVQVDKKSRPLEKMEIKSVTIHANPLAG